MKIKVTNKVLSTEFLKKNLKKDDTVFCLLRHVSYSGMSRIISFIIFRNNNPLWLDYDISQTLNYRFEKGGVRVKGCGMDMGFHVVYTLSSLLFNDGYALKQQWL